MVKTPILFDRCAMTGGPMIYFSSFFTGDGSSITMPDESILLKARLDFTLWDRFEYPTETITGTEVGAKYYVITGFALTTWSIIYPTDEFIGKIPYIVRFDRTSTASVYASAQLQISPILFQAVF